MEYKALKEIAKITMGQSPDSSSYNEEGDGLPFFQGNADFGELYPNERVWCNDPKKIAEPGDILISVRAPIGALNYAKDRCCIGRGLAAITIEDTAERNYVFHLLKARNTDLNNQGTGSTFKAIGKAVLEELQVPQISSDEQQKCMNMMDLLESIIRERKKQIESFDNLIKARFVEMFGDPENNEKQWKMNEFGDICTVRQGLQIPISKRLTEYEDDCYEYITVQYLHGGKEREYIKSPKPTVICTKDDILMTRTGNTGMVITNVDGVFHNNFFLIDFDRTKYDKDFLVNYLNLDIIQADIIRRAGTSTIPDLNHGEFYKIKVYEPPIDLQKEFCLFTKQVDKSKFVVQACLFEFFCCIFKYNNCTHLIHFTLNNK